MLAKDSRLGAYEIRGLLGTGGMGEVYRARDTRLGREVALKVLPSDLAQDPDRRSRFEREARAAAGVNHPNIVTLHSVEEADGVLFITMELVEGRSLREVLLEGELPLARLLDIAVPLAEAVHAAHRQGVTHRDLKPENVMIATNGWVKVLDFGLAKLTRPDLVEDARTQVATFVTTEGPKGTVAYMSPEQAEGKSLDARTDVFSLGVMLYEMAAGRRPFQGDSTVSTLSAILRDMPPPVVELRKNLPAHLAHLIQRCLAKDPDRRYQTALDLRNELETVRDEVRGMKADSGSAAKGIAEAARAAATTGPKRIVVLPFENLGSGDDAFFSAGMTEEITSRLASVSGLAVASRTTAVQYDRTGKTLRQVGTDLAVEFVLEGTVRWARRGDTVRVRVTPQLIRTTDDVHLWADRYDRDLDDIFDVQSEIAERVVKELGVALLEPERKAVNARPTENMEAYQAYLRGLDYSTRVDYCAENFEGAIRMFQRAVDLDPSFAHAHARLSYFHCQMYFFGFDRTPERLVKAKASADHALALDPSLPEAHQALGKYYYSGPRDYAKAIEEYEITRRGYPNRADILVDLAAVYRRKAEFEKSVEYFDQARALEPTNPAPWFERGVSLMFLRRALEADAAFRQAMAIAPDQRMAYGLCAVNRLAGMGDRVESRRILESFGAEPTAGHGHAGTEPAWMFLSILERDFRGLLAWIDRHMPPVFESQFYIITANQYRGLAHAFLGDTAASRDAYRASLDFLRTEAQKRSEDPRIHCALGLCYAGLGEKADAIREGEAAVRLMPVERDSMVGTILEQSLAMILVTVGEHERALDRIERLLAIPSTLTLHTLRLDPRWDPLRSHPRFQKLVTE